MNTIKNLEEIESKIGYPIGNFTAFDAQNGFIIFPINTTGIKRRNILENGKVRMKFSIEKSSQLKDGYFKSVGGYNSKYINKKEYANHYGEYLSYIILNQLEKDVCTTYLGNVKMMHPYASKKIEVPGVISQYELDQDEIFMPISVIVEKFKTGEINEYRNLTSRGKTNSTHNVNNVEIVLKAMEFYYKEASQIEEFKKARKKFFDMCAFDLLFANRDRHDDNYGLKINRITGKIDFYNLFDNEQILGLQENRDNIVKYLESENEYKKFKEKNLTSFIGMPGSVERVKPMDLLKYLLENYYDEMSESLNDIRRYKVNNLTELLEKFPDLSKEHKIMAKLIFEERENEIESTYASINRNREKGLR